MSTKMPVFRNFFGLHRSRAKDKAAPKGGRKTVAKPLRWVLLDS